MGYKITCTLIYSGSCTRIRPSWSPATTLAHEAGHAARYDEAVKNGTITQWLSGCENDESNPYDNHEDEIQGDVSNKSPWEIQKDIYEHNELLK